MSKIDINRNEQIIEYIKNYPLSSSKEIYDGFDFNKGYATLKRNLQVLIKEKFIDSVGKGKGTKYKLNPSFDIIKPIDVNNYFSKEIDERDIQLSFNSSLIKETLNQVSVFTDKELNQLISLQNKYTQNISKLSDSQFNNKLERLAIDLSWKSSQIEGNTYSLLETERLLKEKETAGGKTKDEATMLLNHKESLDFIIANPKYVEPLSVTCIEDIHSILVKDLKISRNLRNHRIGISGTNYKPLDNVFQIKEALQDMCTTINNQDNVFIKSLLALVLISYIQPFADGNKRTTRIISNAILIQHKFCPISFRTVDSLDYKKAMLIFYEQNNISSFKNIFINQFEFAVNTYF